MFAEMKVDYVDHMGTDLSTVNAARVSFSKTSEFEKVKVPFETQDEILGAIEQTGGFDTELRLNSGDQKLVGFLARNNHWSPFAHSFMSFRIKAPIFVARQLVKHQIGLAWNEESRRYVDHDPEFFDVAGWRGRAKNVKQGSASEFVDVDKTWTPVQTNDFHEGESKGLDAALDYSEICRVSLALYNDMLDQGVAPEMARMVLPQSMMVNWIWSGSLLAFARVCNLRLDSHAQAETRVIAQRISEEANQRFPVAWRELVLGNDTETGQT